MKRSSFSAFTIILLAAALALSSLLLAGCANNAETTSTEPAAEPVQTEQPAETQTTPPAKTIEAAPKEQPAEQDPIASLPAADQAKIKLVRKILDGARNREENYFFRYSDPNVLQSDVWVYGDELKRTIRAYDKVDKVNVYNMVYMSRTTKTAEGYCETHKSTCWEGKGPFPETYDKWNIKTPKDWVLELGDDFTWALDNKIADQLYHIIDYKKDGFNIRVWVNDYKGWPYKVEIREGNFEGKLVEMYLYDDMNIDGVKEDDLNPLIVR